MILAQATTAVAAASGHGNPVAGVLVLIVGGLFLALLLTAIGAVVLGGIVIIVSNVLHTFTLRWFVEPQPKDDD